MIPAERMAQQAAEWARSEDAVRAAIVYGSLAQHTADSESDLDLIVVAEPGRREELWQRREEIAELVHERQISWVQEPNWQRPFRHQSWDDQLIELDLTFDEGVAVAWAALARGFLMLADKADVAARLTADLARFERAEFDAPALNGGTWVWLAYLRGRLRRGESWIVRYGLMDTLNNRVVPLLGSAGHSAHAELGAELTGRIHQAAPVSDDPAELRRSLLATAELYDYALNRWADRTGRPRPFSPLAPAVLDRLRRQ